MTRGRKPTIVTFDKGVRPGGGRAKYAHAIPPLPVEPPPELAEDEAKHYREIVGNVAFGHLAAIDQPLVAVFIQHCAIHRRAMRDLAALTELAIETTASMRPHPLVEIVDDQVKVILSLADALGLTPVARCRLKLPVQPTGSGWDDIVS
jgi:P27 family predicted phage terminase small subunit